MLRSTEPKSPFTSKKSKEQPKVLPGNKMFSDQQAVLLSKLALDRSNSIAAPLSNTFWWFSGANTAS